MYEPENAYAIKRKFEPFIKDLTDQELFVLNNMIVDHLRLRSKASSLVFMSKFNVGDRVSWKERDGTIKRGFIIRLNQKTATIKTENDGLWKVPPIILDKEN